MLSYFLARQASDGLPCDDTRNLDDSFSLYSRSYIRDGGVACADEGKKVVMQFKCRATMKTNVRYSLKGSFQRNDVGKPLHLVSAECTCPAGQAPSPCKHVGAMCYGVEDLCRNGVFQGVTSCTAQLQKWNAPPKCRKASEMKFEKLEFGKIKSRNSRAEYDCRPEHLQSLDPVKEGQGLRKV